ncbi:DUF2513 domain-containing protein [Aeoliella mucimassa]|uniref:DUF2513 domain-containing protein n=1 Tax=Aeoliella mucimassa TaxID=2527972 RepID=UPI0018D4789E
MTWAGHDFLDSIRSNEVWNDTKKSIANAGVGVTLAIITELAKTCIKQKLGLE